jgi:hypothetical protein
MSSSSGFETRLDAETASRLAAIALGHVTREYPNRLDHLLTGPGDVQGPRALHPVFYGSFDWHSCVHSYWLLATLARLYPNMQEAGAIRALFHDAFTPAKVAGECNYLRRPSARGFERPYGWAWLLMLQGELMRHEDISWATTLRPLAAAFVERFRDYLPKATYPVRVGTHSNTAFALTLAQEYAVEAEDTAFADLIAATARGWYAQDTDCQGWEPSGEDFLSPSLVETECMRRVLPHAEFRAWLGRFFPRLMQRLPATLFEPARVSDRSDGRIVHLDGLNLSRAWCWRALGSAFPENDPVRAVASEAADRHLAAALPHLKTDYMGEHWLASFALLALRPIMITNIT